MMYIVCIFALCICGSPGIELGVATNASGLSGVIQPDLTSETSADGDGGAADASSHRRRHSLSSIETPLGSLLQQAEDSVKKADEFLMSQSLLQQVVKADEFVKGQFLHTSQHGPTHHTSQKASHQEADATVSTHTHGHSRHETSLNSGGSLLHKIRARVNASDPGFMLDAVPGIKEFKASLKVATGSLNGGKCPDTPDEIKHYGCGGIMGKVCDCKMYPIRLCYEPSAMDAASGSLDKAKAALAGRCDVHWWVFVAVPFLSIILIVCVFAGVRKSKGG